MPKTRSQPIVLCLVFTLLADPNWAGVLLAAPTPALSGAQAAFQSQALMNREIFIPRLGRFSERWPLLKEASAKALAALALVGIGSGAASAQEAKHPPTATELLEQEKVRLDVYRVLLETAHTSEADASEHRHTLGKLLGILQIERGEEFNGNPIKGVGPSFKFSLKFWNPEKRHEARQAALQKDQTRLKEAAVRQDHLNQLSGTLLAYWEANQEAAALAQATFPLSRLSAGDPLRQELQAEINARIAAALVRSAEALKAAHQLADFDELSPLEHLRATKIVEILEAEGRTVQQHVEGVGMGGGSAVDAALHGLEGDQRNRAQKILPTKVDLTVNFFTQWLDWGTHWQTLGANPGFTRIPFDAKKAEKGLRAQTKNLKAARQQALDRLDSKMSEILARQREYDSAQEAVLAAHDALAEATEPEDIRQATEDFMDAATDEQMLGTTLLQAQVELESIGPTPDHVEADFQDAIETRVKDARAAIAYIDSRSKKDQPKYAAVRGALQEFAALGSVEPSAAPAAVTETPAVSADTEIADAEAETEDAEAPPPLISHSFTIPYLTATSGRSSNAIYGDTIKDFDPATDRVMAPTGNVAAGFTVVANASAIKNAKTAADAALNDVKQAKKQIDGNTQWITAAKRDIQDKALADRIATLREAWANLDGVKQQRMETEIRGLERQRLELAQARAASGGAPDHFQPKAALDEVVSVYDMTFKAAQLKHKDALAIVTNLGYQWASGTDFKTLQFNPGMNWLFRKIGELLRIRDTKKLLRVIQESGLLQAEAALQAMESARDAADQAYKRATALENTVHAQMLQADTVMQQAAGSSQYKSAKAEYFRVRAQWLDARSAMDQAGKDLEAADTYVRAVWEYADNMPENLPASHTPLWLRLYEVRLKYVDEKPDYLALLPQRQADVEKERASVHTGEVFDSFKPEGPYGLQQLIVNGVGDPANVLVLGMTVDFHTLEAQKQAAADGRLEAAKAAARVKLAEGAREAIQPKIASLLGQEAALRKIQERLADLMKRTKAGDLGRGQEIYRIKLLETAAHHARTQAEELAAQFGWDIAHVAPILPTDPSHVFTIPSPKVTESARRVARSLLNTYGPKDPAPENDLHFVPAIITFKGFRNFTPPRDYHYPVGHPSAEGLLITAGELPITTRNKRLDKKAQADQDAVDKQDQLERERRAEDLIVSLAKEVTAAQDAFDTAMTSYRLAEARLNLLILKSDAGLLNEEEIHHAEVASITALTAVQSARASALTADIRLKLAISGNATQSEGLVPLALTPLPEIPVVLPELTVQEREAQNIGQLAITMFGHRDPDSEFLLHEFLGRNGTAEAAPHDLIALSQAVGFPSLGTSPTRKTDELVENLELAIEAVQAGHELRGEPVPDDPAALQEALRSYQEPGGRMTRISKAFKNAYTGDTITAAWELEHLQNGMSGISLLVKIAARQELWLEGGAGRTLSKEDARAQVMIAASVGRAGKAMGLFEKATPGLQRTLVNRAIEEGLRMGTPPQKGEPVSPLYWRIRKGARPTPTRVSQAFSAVVTDLNKHPIPRRLVQNAARARTIGGKVRQFDAAMKILKTRTRRQLIRATLRALAGHPVMMFVGGIMGSAMTMGMLHPHLLPSVMTYFIDPIAPNVSQNLFNPSSFAPLLTYLAAVLVGLAYSRKKDLSRYISLSA